MATADISSFKVLFRILRGPELAPEDFRSNLAKCLPMRGAEQTDSMIWTGLSTYDSAAQAERIARRYPRPN